MAKEIRLIQKRGFKKLVRSTYYDVLIDIYTLREETQFCHVHKHADKNILRVLNKFALSGYLRLVPFEDKIFVFFGKELASLLIHEQWRRRLVSEQSFRERLPSIFGE